MSFLKEENDKLNADIYKLEEENRQLKEQLKKYTNPKRNKKYYEKNKEELKKRNYKKSIPTQEQRKIWNKQYYEKKKSL